MSERGNNMRGALVKLQQAAQCLAGAADCELTRGQLAAQALLGISTLAAAMVPLVESLEEVNATLVRIEQRRGGVAAPPASFN